MFCKSCGKEIPEGQELCDECAAKETAETVVETETVENNTSSNAAQSEVVNNTDPNAKSKMVAGLLGIFLGWLGIHNFYLGYNTKGLIQLLVSLIGGVLSCGVATFAISVWGIIEGIMIFTGSINTDANGNPLKD